MLLSGSGVQPRLETRVSVKSYLLIVNSCSRKPASLGARKRDFALLTPKVATVFNTPNPRAARQHCFPHTYAKSLSLGYLSHRMSRGDGTCVFTAVGRDMRLLIQRLWAMRWWAKRTKSLPTRHGENCLCGITL